MQKSVLKAKELGYTVTEDGDVLSPDSSPITLSVSGNGYKVFSVRIGPREEVKHSRSVLVHQLAALQWFGQRELEKKGVEIRHYDGDKGNNQRSNLLLGTHSQNMMDMPEEVRKRRAKTAAKTLRRLTSTEAAQLRREREAGASYASLMSRFGIAKSTVSYIVNKKTYNDDEPSAGTQPVKGHA